MSLNTCSNHHEEICHEGNKCPLCEALQTTEEFKGEVTDLEDSVDELKHAISDAIDELDEQIKLLTATNKILCADDLIEIKNMLEL